MITKEATYKIAFENKSNALKEKERTYNTLLSAAYVANPRLAEIDRELSAVGANLAIVTLSGDKQKLTDLKAKSEALSAEKKVLLDKAQVPTLTYDCDICNDTGYVAGKICECIKKEASHVFATELSREMPLNDCSFENFDLKYYPDETKENTSPRKRMASIFKLCSEYASNFNPETSGNLLFMGDAGLGKTHLTLAIVSELVKKGFMPIYSSAENLFSTIESEKFKDEGRGSYDTILKCDLLVIDDLGTEMITTFTKSALYNIVNTRLMSKKPTIINTNLTMKEIEELYSPRISSRFIGEYDWRKFLGHDIRQQKLL